MSRSYGTAKLPMKNLFAKFIQKYSDDNSVFNMYLCQFYDTGGILQKSATLANDINRLVCRHPLHLDLHCLQSSRSLGEFCFFIYLKLCRRNFYHLLFFCALTVSERLVDCEL